MTVATPPVIPAAEVRAAQSGPVEGSLRPTPSQLAYFAAYCRRRPVSAKVTAHDLGISYNHLRNTISEMYRRLGVHGSIEAAATLGWLVVP